MTRRERLTAIFEGRVPDRPAVKLWSAAPGQALKHPKFEQVRDAAVEKTDLFLGAGSPFHIYCGARAEEVLEVSDEPTDSPEWVERVATFHTPEGDLRSVHTTSTIGKPGYEKEHLLKEPEDIRRLLSIPYEPFRFTRETYDEVDAGLGDAGVVKFNLAEPMYALQRQIGSENFAFWSLEAPGLLLEAIETFTQRVEQHTRAAIDAGIRGVFGWVGPELCIPPLMPPSAFEKLVFPYNKRIIDLVHDAGGRFWVHCHGRMRGMIERFVAMGVDVLNPIEPPPMGDLEMDEAFALVGDRMGLEGNIETHDLMTATPEALLAKIRATLDAGRNRRLILCPSSGYQENITPSDAEITNWMLYINEGVRYAEAMAG